MSKFSKYNIIINFLKLVFLSLFVAEIIFPHFLLAQNPEEEKAELRERLRQIQLQVNQYREKIKSASQQEQSLKGQINLLENKIKKLNLEIESLTLAIVDTSKRLDIIRKTTQAIERNIISEKKILSRTVRIIYENDSFNYLEVFFKKGKLSDIFADVKAIEEIQESLLTSLSEIKDLKRNLEEEKILIEEREEELANLKTVQEVQTASLSKNKQSKGKLLAQTQNVKSELIDKVEISQATMETIRNQLYQLEGLGVSLKFGDALKYAQVATVKTGTRAALLLAMLKKESEWGTNVGTGTWREDMHPRDHEAFIEITKKLGLNPDITPVSRKPSYGWGGAMGPAQFLPNTWLSYEGDIARLTGHNPPNPWDIGDAFMACAYKLSKAGAGAQTYDAEWKAAQIYFAGRRWNNPRYYFYGDSVMELATQFQKQVDILERGEQEKGT
jgi:peptidoglycan hydrolase CwlO-like protein